MNIKEDINVHVYSKISMPHDVLKYNVMSLKQQSKANIKTRKVAFKVLRTVSNKILSLTICCE